MASRNDESNIGMRLGRLFQQYGLRIAYAQYKAEMYEQEREAASARGQGYKSLQAQVAKQSWEVYRKNLITKRRELEEAVQTALIGYSDTQRRVWFSYFMEGKSSTAIMQEVQLSDRTVERMIARMKDDMELKFTDSAFKRIGEATKPKWTSAQLASFLTENPSQDYLAAVQDMLDYGIVDLDALEFDHDFQNFVESGRRPTDGE